jgi:hypothetical protein
MTHRQVVREFTAAFPLDQPNLDRDGLPVVRDGGIEFTLASQNVASIVMLERAVGQLALVSRTESAVFANWLVLVAPDLSSRGLFSSFADN